MYAERTPYFLEVKRLRDLNEEQAKAMRRMKKQRDEELKALKGRNEMINKTLGAWNRALGQASANSEAEALRQRMESLEKLLAEHPSLEDYLKEGNFAAFLAAATLELNKKARAS